MSENKGTNRPGLKPWEQRDNEPDDAYRAFECFLDIPPTEKATVLRAAREYTQNPAVMQVAPYLKRWASKYDWLERRREYMRHLRQKRRVAQEGAYVASAKEKGRTLASTEDRVLELSDSLIDTLLEKLEDSHLKEMWTPQQIVSGVGRANELLSILAKVRAVTGERDDAQTPEVSDEELDEAHRLALGDEPTLSDSKDD